MNWAKQGLIYCPQGRFGWDQSHAQVPTVDVVDDRTWRIYYAARDADNRSRTSYIEVDAADPARIRYVHPEPILPLGAPGTFDDCGIMPSWVVAVDEVTRYLYYAGWTVRQTVPYHTSIGLAVSKDGGRTFCKAGNGPLFGPTLHEPFFTGTSCVLVHNRVWKNWYQCGTGWFHHDGRMEPMYHLKYAESVDGINWRREGVVAVDLTGPTEGGLTKASVLCDSDRFHMWYSYRSRAGFRTHHNCSYRIGYAESTNGIRWRREDQHAGIDVSCDGWDSEMIAYPHVVNSGTDNVMFYNGNGFGRSGFGYATGPNAVMCQPTPI